MGNLVERRITFVCAKSAPDAKAAPDKPKVYTFVASDGEFDRYNDRLNVEGWDLKAFNDNPIILYNHDAGLGGWFTAPTKALPIGRGKAYVQGQKLMIDVELDPGDPFAVDIGRKLDFGALNTGSVRYIMKKYHENDRGGFDSDEHELLEFSVVTIPGNSRAVRLKDAFSDAQFDEFADAIADRLRKRDASKPAAKDVTATENCGCGCPKSACEPVPQEGAASLNLADFASALTAEIARFKD